MNLNLTGTVYFKPNPKLNRYIRLVKENTHRDGFKQPKKPKHRKFSSPEKAAIPHESNLLYVHQIRHLALVDVYRNYTNEP